MDGPLRTVGGRGDALGRRGRTATHLHTFSIKNTLRVERGSFVGGRRVCGDAGALQASGDGGRAAGVPHKPRAGQGPVIMSLFAEWPARRGGGGGVQTPPPVQWAAADGSTALRDCRHRRRRASPPQRHFGGARCRPMGRRPVAAGSGRTW